MNIKISNSFLLVLAIMIALNGLKLFFFIMLSCFIHELGHFLAIKYKRLKIDVLSLNFVGGCITCNALNYQNNFYLVIVYIAGITFNILTAFCCNFIAIHGFYSRNFFILGGINFLLAFFNLLPIKTLDGHFILKHFLLIFIKNTRKVLYFCNLIGFLCNILLLTFGVFYIFKLNFSIFIISIYLLTKTMKNYTYF